MSRRCGEASVRVGGRDDGAHGRGVCCCCCCCRRCCCCWLDADAFNAAAAAATAVGDWSWASESTTGVFSGGGGAVDSAGRPDSGADSEQASRGVADEVTPSGGASGGDWWVTAGGGGHRSGGGGGVSLMSENVNEVFNIAITSAICALF